MSNSNEISSFFGLSYDPFGMIIVGRIWVVGSYYKFGFNGLERDEEFNENLEFYTTYFRECDPRLGRWFCRDPLTFPWQSPYCMMDNNPVLYIDPTGAGIFDSKAHKQAKKDAKKFEKAGYDGARVISEHDEQGHEIWWAQASISTGETANVIAGPSHREPAPDKNFVEYKSGGIESKVTLQSEAGILKWKDSGASGTEVTAFSIDIFKFDLVNTIDKGENYDILTDGFINGQFQGKFGAVKIENGKVDGKVGYTYKAEVVTSMNAPLVIVPTITECKSEAAIGTPYTELKATYSDYTLKINVGIQEDWSRSVNYYLLGLGVKLDVRFQYAADVRLNFLENLLKSE